METSDQSISFTNGDLVIADDGVKEEYAIFIAVDNLRFPFVCDRLNSEGKQIGLPKHYKSIRLMTDEEIKTLVKIQNKSNG